MSDTTAVLGLALPKPDDYYDIEIFNENARLLDAAAAQTKEEFDTLRDEAQQAHDALQAHTQENAAQLVALETALTAHAARIARLEDALFNNVTQNPFMVTFATLGAVSVSKGIWNKTRQRMEC